MGEKTDPAEKAKLMKFAAFLFVASLAFMGSSCYLVTQGKLNISGPVKAQELSSFEDRLRYTLRFQSLGVATLILCVFNVINARRSSGALNPLQGPEHKTQGAKNVFLNSLEQFIISVMNQYIMLVYLEPATILKVIPLINYWFAIGRVAFMVGYPLKRTFGFSLSFLPNMIMTGFNIYKFVQFNKLI